MQTVFNQAQLDLLDMMSFVKSPHMLSELMQVISDYSILPSKRKKRLTGCGRTAPSARTKWKVSGTCTNVLPINKPR